MPPVAVLAGGLATRLRPLTDTIPKAMIEVAGEPFIAHQLRLLKREGMEKIVLCVSYKARQIRDYVGDGAAFGLDVRYSEDGAKLRGTGGALRRALPLLGDEFIVLYGDSWLDAAYPPIVKAFRESGLPALMTVFRNEGRWDTSNVWFERGRIRLYDKKERRPEMAYIDWGLGVLRAELLAVRGPEEVFDLGEVYGELSRQGRLAGFEVSQRFYEIGSPQGLAETEALMNAALARKL
ncbi:MAG: nucleotidyltransferase family protein [Caulobacteraceae bacterium]|nr:nucleotidyltransferase family protein [Caulobacteraceae bacterium]